MGRVNMPTDRFNLTQIHTERNYLLRVYYMVCPINNSEMRPPIKILVKSKNEEETILD